jgi:cytochrome P450
MHRDTSIFPSPETFLPDRWLARSGSSYEDGSSDDGSLDKEDRERLARMNQQMMPFGAGSRVCGGQNLAGMMLKIAVAAVARNFDVVAPKETTERSMEIKDSFVSGVFISVFVCTR